MTNQLIAPAVTLAASHPEFVTLKPVGGDPVCGMSRSFWYSAEKKGLIQLNRVRLPGRQRGRVLLPVPQAVALLRRLGSRAAEKGDTAE